MIEDTKNIKGSNGVYHSACNLSGRINNKVPKDDWCKVDNIIPAMTNGMYILFTNLVGISQPNFSQIEGKNSRKSTVVYNITHHATSNIAEWGCHITIGCQMSHGCPKSSSKLNITIRYPRNPVKTAGLASAWNFS